MIVVGVMASASRCVVQGVAGLLGAMSLRHPSPGGMERPRSVTSVLVLWQANKAVRVVRGSSPVGPFRNASVSDLLTPHLTEGPSVFTATLGEGGGPQTYRMYYDCFVDDRFGVSESSDLLTWASVHGTNCSTYGSELAIPPGAHHGSVVCVTGAELARLQSAFPA